MTTVQAAPRQALLTRGWYVVTELELAFLGLSGRAHDLLIVLKHLQGQDADAFPARERLADMLGVSVRTVQTALGELRRKGAISVRRTGRTSRYTALYTRATVEELRTLLGAEVRIPDELLTPREIPGSCTSERQDPGSSPLYKEPPTKNEITAPLRGADGAAAPTVHDLVEDAMSRTTSTPRRGHVVDDLDPVAALGLWESQELPEDPADAGVWFPLQEPSPAPTARRTAPRTQAQLDSPMALAMELDRQLRAAGLGGPAPVNRAALARNVSTWKRDGLVPGQIRSMIARYVADAALRTDSRAPWIDFVAKRHKLLAIEARTAAGRAVEDHRDAGADYWLGTAAGGR